MTGHKFANLFKLYWPILVAGVSILLMWGQMTNTVAANEARSTKNADAIEDVKKDINQIQQDTAVIKESVTWIKDAIKKDRRNR